MRAAGIDGAAYPHAGGRGSLVPKVVPTGRGRVGQPNSRRGPRVKDPSPPSTTDKFSIPGTRARARTETLMGK